MISAWMLYVAAVSLVLGAAAWLVEYGLRLYGRPGRWAWAGAMAGSLAVPALALLLPSRPTAAGDVSLSLGPVSFASPAAAGGAGSWLEPLRGLDPALGWLWLAASLVAAAYVAVSYGRLRARRRAWREAEVEGRAVLVSDGAGPAVVGVRRGRIVLPEWVLDADDATRRLVLAHEAEHVAAGDPRLLAAGLAALVLTPWSPGAWWQLRRLRQATELDCDARVLGRHGELKRYARLLLEVGARGADEALVAAFAAPRSLLGRRIEALTATLPADRRRRALAAAAGAVVLLAGACLGPEPDHPMPTEVVGTPRPAQAPAQDGPSYKRTANPDEPSFTRYTKKPELANRAEVVTLLKESYPPLLKNAGVVGQTLLWVKIDEQGQVVGSRIGTGSGHDELDAAALKVATGMRFTPAEDEGRPVAVWIQLPIVFKSDGAPASAAPALDLPSSTALPMKAPYTPYTKKPELSNREEVTRLLAESYPPLLKDAGVGGRAILWMNIDERGRVSEARIANGTGHDALDIAAMKVGLSMRFTPAENEGRPTAVWIQIPIAFKASAPPPPPAPPSADAAPVRSSAPPAPPPPPPGPAPVR